MEQEKFTVGELADLAGVSSRTIRYYDKKGLLCPVAYSENQYRQYDQSSLLRLQQVLMLKYIGFSLEEIMKIFQSQKEMSITELLAEQKRMLLEKREKLNQVIAVVEKTQEYCSNAELELPQLSELVKMLNYNESSNKIFEYFEKYGAKQQDWYPWLFRQMRIQEGERVLDIGGGYGLVWRRISSNLAGIHRVEEFLEWEEEKDLPGAKDFNIEKGSIRFENVTFGYGGEAVLKNLKIEIRPGEKVAFIGKSGEGKSTLLQLLCRFYQPDSGRIFIDGRLLDTYTFSSLRGQIAAVQQENGLFQGSLRRNIIFSEDRSQDDRIWEILEGLKLKDNVKEFPEGLDTVVGSGGRDMSGGQKQRIAIARCIYRRPKILLLDEATSALDEETEEAVNVFLREQLFDTTILTVAHRFAAVLAAEKCVVIEQGSVTGIGTHEYLQRNNGQYRRLYEMYQNSRQQKSQVSLMDSP